MPVFWGIFSLLYYALWGQAPNSMLTHHNCSSIGYWFNDWQDTETIIPAMRPDTPQGTRAKLNWMNHAMHVNAWCFSEDGLCSGAVTNNPQMSGCHLSFIMCVCVRVRVCVHCHFARDSAHWGHSGDGAATTLTQASCHAEYQVQWQTCT